MTKTSTKKETVLIFSNEIERKQLTVQELVNLLNNRFTKENLEVGKISYYILALKKENLINLSYDSIVLIVKKFFEKHGMACNTTTKCMAYYNRKLKDMNYSEDFKITSKTKVAIDLSEIIF